MSDQPGRPRFSRIYHSDVNPQDAGHAPVQNPQNNTVWQHAPQSAIYQASAGGQAVQMPGQPGFNMQPMQYLITQPQMPIGNQLLQIQPQQQLQNAPTRPRQRRRNARQSAQNAGRSTQSSVEQLLVINAAHTAQRLADLERRQRRSRSRSPDRRRSRHRYGSDHEEYSSEDRFNHRDRRLRRQVEQRNETTQRLIGQGAQSALGDQLRLENGNEGAEQPQTHGNNEQRLLTHTPRAGPLVTSQMAQNPQPVSSNQDTALMVAEGLSALRREVRADLAGIPRLIAESHNVLGAQVQHRLASMATDTQQQLASGFNAVGNLVQQEGANSRDFTRQQLIGGLSAVGDLVQQEGANSRDFTQQQLVGGLSAVGNLVQQEGANSRDFTRQQLIGGLSAVGDLVQQEGANSRDFTQQQLVGGLNAVGNLVQQEGANSRDFTQQQLVGGLNAVENLVRDESASRQSFAQQQAESVYDALGARFRQQINQRHQLHPQQIEAAVVGQRQALEYDDRNQRLLEPNLSTTGIDNGIQRGQLASQAGPNTLHVHTRSAETSSSGTHPLLEQDGDEDVSMSLDGRVDEIKDTVHSKTNFIRHSYTIEDAEAKKSEFRNSANQILDSFKTEYADNLDRQKAVCKRLKTQSSASKVTFERYSYSNFIKSTPQYKKVGPCYDALIARLAKFDQDTHDLLQSTYYAIDHKVASVCSDIDIDTEFHKFNAKLGLLWTGLEEIRANQTSKLESELRDIVKFMVDLINTRQAIEGSYRAYSADANSWKSILRLFNYDPEDLDIPVDFDQMKFSLPSIEEVD